MGKTNLELIAEIKYANQNANDRRAWLNKAEKETDLDGIIDTALETTITQIGRGNNIENDFNQHNGIFYNVEFADKFDSGVTVAYGDLKSALQDRMDKRIIEVENYLNSLKTLEAHVDEMNCEPYFEEN